MNDDISVTIVDFTEYTAIIEYREAELLTRVHLPRQYLNTSLKGPATLPSYYLDYGVNYSDVDLQHHLGEYINDLPVSVIENELRERGLWLKQDYLERPDIVALVVKRFKTINPTLDLDVTKVLNAAQR